MSTNQNRRNSGGTGQIRCTAMRGKEASIHFNTHTPLVRGMGTALKETKPHWEVRHTTD